MKKRALSQAQLAALVWAGVLAPAAELLPGAALSAGRGAWLAPLAALPLALLSVWLLTRLARDRGLARGILDGLGPWLGRGVLLFYLVWALGLLALTVRALLGRRRLKQAAARYQDPDCRMGCGYILCAVHDLLGQPGLPEDPLSPEDAEDLVYLEREVWYSGHTMTEDQRRRCLALLESARRVWREQTPALRRFAARFITCKVF